MDMAIAVIDRDKNELQFAGAYNPLYLIRQGNQLLEFRGDRQPIGIHWQEKEFNDQHIRLQEGDTIYLFSDGFVDQYGERAFAFQHQKRDIQKL